MGSTGVREFTVFEVAKLLCVAPRTVGKWIDNGKLKSSGLSKQYDRLIQYSELKSFCEKFNLPLNLDDV